MRGAPAAGGRVAPGAVEFMDIVFTQTSDAEHYLDLMLQTSRTVRAYCSRHDCQYDAYIGVKRGYWPWQATFNRIYMLRDLAERGRFDWAVYMDADAFINDLAFDLRAYLHEHAASSAILVRSGVTEHWWDVNAGVLLLNLRHPRTHRLLDQWRAAYEAISDETLRAWANWGNPNDQEMLHACLREQDGMRDEIHLASPEVLNSPKAQFIQQLLRGLFSDMETRRRAIETRVAEVLASEARPQPSESQAAVARAFISKAYRATLRREVDAYGLDHFLPIFEHLGFEAGAQLLIEQLLGSAEYQGARLLTRNERRLVRGRRS